ncbi:g11935 [Coccomyxa viridis]|uniref:G11935 protein n=1 Tax=Coccomyxa viridis TaxID=1274662 RepID=A0ABP1G943_9CHLO
MLGPLRFNLKGSKLDVNHTGAGIGDVLYWRGTIAEIALYERLDPGKPTWKLVGVFPVSDGFAQLDLKKLEGKGQTGDTALYIASGTWLKRLLGGGWSPTIDINREEEIIWQVPSIVKSVRV